MTARETAEALVFAIRGKMFSEQVKAAEAALTAAYEEGTTELIVNAQVEYARGQADERQRCIKIAKANDEYDGTVSPGCGFMIAEAIGAVDSPATSRADIYFDHD